MIQVAGNRTYELAILTNGHQSTTQLRFGGWIWVSDTRLSEHRRPSKLRFQFELLQRRWSQEQRPILGSIRHGLLSDPFGTDTLS